MQRELDDSRTAASEEPPVLTQAVGDGEHLDVGPADVSSPSALVADISSDDAGGGCASGSGSVPVQGSASLVDAGSSPASLSPPASSEGDAVPAPSVAAPQSELGDAHAEMVCLPCSLEGLDSTAKAEVSASSCLSRGLPTAFWAPDFTALSSAAATPRFRACRPWRRPRLRPSRRRARRKSASSARLASSSVRA
jgi:hypothetical protein